jgi:hypothetical protein
LQTTTKEAVQVTEIAKTICMEGTPDLYAWRGPFAEHAYTRVVWCSKLPTSQLLSNTCANMA